MKRTLWLALILLLVCLFAFFACDNNGDTHQTPHNTQSGVTDNTTELKTDAHVHAFGEWSTVKEATCTVKGKQERSCSCGENETKSIDALGHTEVIDASVAATCTTDGKTEGKHCSVCSETLIAQNNIPASHTDGEWVVDTNATCTEDGSKHQVCAVCSTSIKTEKISATGHTDGEWITDNNATCAVDGIKHQICFACAETIKIETISAKGHSEVIDKAVDPTCTETGLTEGKHCSTCDAVMVKQKNIPETGHNYLNTIQKKTSCLTETYVVSTCQNCQHSFKTPIKPIEIAIDNPSGFGINSAENKRFVPIVVTANGGYGTYQYLFIHQNDKSGEYTPNPNYTVEMKLDCSSYPLEVIVIDEAGNQTSVNVKITIDKVNFTTSISINVLGVIQGKHVFGDWTINQKATCVNDGIKQQNCSICNEIHIERIPANGHKKGDWIIDKQSTCIELGSQRQICSVCQETLSTQTIPSVEHTYTEKYDASNNTLIYTCRYCDYSYSKSADIELAIKETYKKFDTVGFKIQTQIDIEATGGYGTIYFKYEVFLTQYSTTPIEKLTYDFSSDKDWYGLKAADTVNGCVIQVTAKDDYGHVTVTRVLITNNGIEIID